MPGQRIKWCSMQSNSQEFTSNYITSAARHACFINVVYCAHSIIVCAFLAKNRFDQEVLNLWRPNLHTQRECLYIIGDYIKTPALTTFSGQYLPRKDIILEGLHCCFLLLHDHHCYDDHQHQQYNDKKQCPSQ